MTKAEESAMKAYPNVEQPVWDESYPKTLFVRHSERNAFIKGYEQAEKDLAPAFEFPFYVPDDDGFIVFTPMDNQTIRRELKLKKGERVIVSIRKEHEKE